MGPSQAAVGGLTQSSPTSGIFFQGNGQSQAVVNSHLVSPYANSSNLLSGAGQPNLGPVTGDMNSVTNSGPSVGASSVVTDANSALPRGPHLQRCASINTESYMRLPASPLSFTSNNMSISGSSVINGSHQDPNGQKAQQNQQGFPTAMPLPASQSGQMSLPLGMGSRSFIQDPISTSLHLQKKPRLDTKQEDILQHQLLQQLLQRPDSMQIQSRNPQLQALIQQQRLRQQQHQLLQSLPPLQRAQLQQQQQQHQQQQMQIRQQQMQQLQQPISGVKRPYDSGICARRLMQYLYHQRQRPSDNGIAYWRKFVAEYYSPRAKKRWCLSLYDNVGHHALGVFPQAAMDAWQCDLCGSKSGRGFEATYEVLPRLNQIKYGSGVIDELLFLDLPRECRFPSGIMMLDYGKAVQESVYEQLRVVHEGQLRIVFTPDLKILCWEFCARRHEELISRKLVSPQVNQLVQVAQKCQSTISEAGPDGVSQQDWQTNSNMVLSAGRQLAKSLELQSLNDLGFSKRYVRCLQISEVVNSMKDLIDFCGVQKVGPIDGLKSYPRHASVSKVQIKQELEQLASVNNKSLPTGRNTLNNNMNIAGVGPVGPGALSGSAQGSMALNNYQNIVIRQSNPLNSSVQHQLEASSSFNNNNSSQSPSSSFQVHHGNFMPGTGFSSSSPHHLQQQPLTSANSSSLHQRDHHFQSNNNNNTIQQQMIQQLLHEMSNNNNNAQHQSFSVQNGSVARNGSSMGNNNGSTPVSAATPSLPDPATSRSNSFKATSSNTDSGDDNNKNNGFNQRAQQNLQLPEESIEDVEAHEFSDNGFFDSDFGSYNWKV
ncbi:hypothetical protein ACFE04_004551 [Oxalis oulophora]